MQDQGPVFKNETEYFEHLQEQYMTLVQLSEPSPIKAYENHKKNPKIQQIIAQRDQIYHALHDGGSLTYLYKCKKVGELSAEKNKVILGQQAYIYIEDTKQYCFVNHLQDPMTTGTPIKVDSFPLKATGLLDQQQLQSIHRVTGHSAGIFNQTNANIKLSQTPKSKIADYETGIALIKPFVEGIINHNNELELEINALEKEQEEKNKTSKALQALNVLINSKACLELIQLESNLAKYNNLKIDPADLPLYKQWHYARVDLPNNKGNSITSVFINGLKENIEKAMQGVRDTEVTAIKKIRDEINELKNNVTTMMKDLEKANLIGKPVNQDFGCEIDYAENNIFNQKYDEISEGFSKEMTFGRAISMMESLREQKENVQRSCRDQKLQMEKFLKRKILVLERDIAIVKGQLGIAKNNNSYLDDTEKALVKEIKNQRSLAEKSIAELNREYDNVSFAKKQVCRTLNDVKESVTGKKENVKLDYEQISVLISIKNKQLITAQNQVIALKADCCDLVKINEYHIDAKKIICNMELLDEQTPQGVLKAICQQKGYIAVNSTTNQELSASAIRNVAKILVGISIDALPHDENRTPRIQRLLMNPLRIKAINELDALHQQQKRGQSPLDDKAFNKLIMLLLDAEDKTIKAVNDIASDVEGQTNTYEIKLCLIKLILEATGVSSPMIVLGKEQALVQKETQVTLDDRGNRILDDKSARETTVRDIKTKVERPLWVKQPFFKRVDKKDLNKQSIPIYTKPGVKHLENAITHPVYGKDNIQFIKHFLFDIKGMKKSQPLFHNKEDPTLSEKTGTLINKIKEVASNLFGEDEDPLLEISMHAEGFENVAGQKFSEKQEHFEAFDYTRKYLNNETDSFFILPENYDAIMLAISEANTNQHANISKMATVFNAVSINIDNYVKFLNQDEGKTRKSAKEIKQLATALTTFRNELIPVLLQNKGLADLEEDAKKLARQHFQKKFGGRVLLDILQILTFAWIIVMPIRVRLGYKKFFSEQTHAQDAMDLKGQFTLAKA